MEINATGVKVEGFTLLSEGWNIMVNGDGSQINGNIITLDVNLNGCHQTCTNNLVTYCCYPNGTARFYGIINMNGNYSQAAYNQLNGGTIGVGGHYNTVFANSGVGNIGTGGVGDWNLIFNNTLTGSWGSRYRYGSWDGGISIASAGNIVAKNTVYAGDLTILSASTPSKTAPHMGSLKPTTLDTTNSSTTMSRTARGAPKSLGTTQPTRKQPSTTTTL